MAFLHTRNVKLAGVSACVPKAINKNRNLPTFEVDEIERFITSTGVEQRRIADNSTTSSDLCFNAAERLLVELNWRNEEIECLIFVSQTPDYILPSTSCILQNRLNLSQDCFTLDISLGCSGWVYGSSVITSLMQIGKMRKGLLLVGDTVLKYCSSHDNSTWPLFGDAGTASAFEFVKGHSGFKFHLASDGSGFEAIIIPEGGFRNPFNNQSLIENKVEDKICRNNLQMILNGMDVFAFGISKGPETINKLCDHYNINLDKVDSFFFHQANFFMNEKIRKKLKLPLEKVPYSIAKFGNTSVSTIPLTMVTECRSKLMNTKQKNIACAFGVGLSWGSVYFESDKLVCPELIEI